MMIETKKINYDLSKKIYKKYKQLFKRGSCYSNCFELTMFKDEELEGCKIAFCYEKGSFLGLMCRHCILINNKGEVIDVTKFCYGEKSYAREYFENLEYYIFKEYTFEEYRNALEQSDRRLDLKCSIKEEIDIFNEVLNEPKYGFPQIVENDYYTYIMPLVMKNSKLARIKAERIKEVLKMAKEGE